MQFLSRAEEDDLCQSGQLEKNQLFIFFDIGLQDDWSISDQLPYLTGRSLQLCSSIQIDDARLVSGRKWEGLNLTVQRLCRDVTILNDQFEVGVEII